ncbi:MAG TPA: hypothetical protein VFB66_01785 [Tepidisphaeraceae bacterium]|nr:hypothetical protein [Tepidisphaeraceae bacterium]
MADLTADDIIRLMDHAKKLGIPYFEGPGGLRFGFGKPRPSLTPSNLTPVADDTIPLPPPDEEPLP